MRMFEDPRPPDEGSRLFSPFRPRLIRGANYVGPRLGAGLRAPLEPERILDRALGEGADISWMDPEPMLPLERLTRSLKEEARLSYVGEWLTYQRLVDGLRSRAGLRAFLESPEVIIPPSKPPIVIVGLQRTGTTFLHRLLTQNPTFRGMLSWEGLSPVPLKKGVSEADGPRIRQAKLAQGVVRYMAPDFFAIHPIEAESVEEEIVLLDHTLYSTVSEALYNVPSFGAWLESQDHTSAYAYLARCLNALMAQRPKKRWVLKTPHHMEWLETLAATFPGAKFIHTHRKPSQCLASFCSMTAHSRGMFSDHVDAHEVGRYWWQKTQRMVRRALEDREGMMAGDVLDLQYEALIQDPIAQARRIHDFVDEPFTPEVEGALRAGLGVHRQHKYGRHRYSLEEFGLRKEEVEASFSSYNERFGL